MTDQIKSNYCKRDSCADELVLKQPEYFCPMHGDIKQYTICFSFVEEFSRFNKHLCLLCYVEKLSESGVCEAILQE